MPFHATEPLPRFEVSIRRIGANFSKVRARPLSDRQAFIGVETGDAPVNRAFYFEIWSSAHPLIVWHRPQLLFRGTAHDPLGITVEYPARPMRIDHSDVPHDSVHDNDSVSPDDSADASDSDGDDGQDYPDFERRDRSDSSRSTFTMIVPRYKGRTRLKLYSMDFNRVFRSQDSTKPAAEIELP